LKYLLRALGGIAVPSRKKKSNLTDAIINKFNSSEYLNLAVTPEGTRSKVEKWRTGFLYIAYGADVPVQLGVIDYARKEIIIKDEFIPSGNIENDMDFVKNYYSKFDRAAKYPEKFTV
ncbi:MAG: acyltransferase, partial [Muribaculaceae bacterium]|nr:acyltransferase [Muribaculaceae bacterium]